MKRLFTYPLLLSVFLILLTVCLFSCTKEDRLEPIPEEEPIVEEDKHGFHFTITVKGVSSKAGIERLDDKDKYVFREGDKLYVSDKPAGTVPSVCGELSMTSLPGQTTGTFAGDLNTDPAAGTKLYVTLLSAEDKIHTISGTAPLRYVDTVRTFPTGSPTTPASVSGALASSLEQAINWYSDFTGSFLYGSSSCILSQGTSFIEFKIRYLDIYVNPEEAFSKEATIKIINTDGESEITTDRREGIVSLIKDEAGYAYSLFFVAFPGGTTLNGANVDIAPEGFPDMIFPIAGTTLQKSKKYNVKRDIADDFSIETTEANTTITFNNFYRTGAREQSGVQYRVGDDVNWTDYEGPLSSLGAHVVVRFRAKRVSLDEGVGMYDNQNNTDAEGPKIWPTNAGHPVFNFNKPVLVYGDIMSLLCDNDYNRTNYLNKHEFAGSFWGVGNMTIHDERNLVLSAQDLTTGTKHYQNMFRGSSIVNGNHIVVAALKMGNYSCNSMFKECNSLTSAPVLKSTTMESFCYQSMFEKCTSLTTAPVLPATTLAESCYRQMFSGCTSLTDKVPELPATTLENLCYFQMFSGCTHLTKAPTLPATTLKYKCYFQMFLNCKALQTAPVLPASDLVTGCYYGMFKDSGINTIKCLAQTGINSGDGESKTTGEWLPNRAGTFTKKTGVVWYETEGDRTVNTIPSNWTVVEADE